MAQCILLTGGIWNKPEWAKFQKTIGAYRIATALEEAGYSTYVLDFISELSIEEITKLVSDNITEDTIWVGFSSTFYWFPDHGKNQGNGDILKLKEMYWCEDAEVHKLIDAIKTINSKVKIIYGGTKAEFFYGNDPRIDHYVIGLADTSIISITEDIASGKSLPLLVDSREFKESDIHSVFTKWSYPGMTVLDNESLPIELARGCIFKCKFCTYPLLGKKKGTYFRPLNQVKEELLENYYKFGITNYYITDDTVNDDIDKLYALVEMLKTLPFKPTFTGFFRLDLIHRFKEQAKLLVDMGVVGIFFGIETLQHESARSIGKGLHPNKVKDTLYWLKQEWKDKVNISAGIILGLPYDTLEYFDNLIEWCTDSTCPIDHIQFYPLHLNKRDISKPGMYVSEFNTKPEIYGYTFPGDNNFMYWELESQGLSYTLVDRISKEFNVLRSPYNKVAGFEMTKYMSIGVDIKDLYALTQTDLNKKYDIAKMNESILLKYKQKLGLLV